MAANLYQTTVEIVNMSDGKDIKVIGRYQYAVFAETAEQAHAQAVKDWQEKWTFPWSMATGLTVTVDDEVKNGTYDVGVIPGQRPLPGTIYLTPTQKREEC